MDKLDNKLTTTIPTQQLDKKMQFNKFSDETGKTHRVFVNGNSFTIDGAFMKGTPKNYKKCLVCSEVKDFESYWVCNKQKCKQELPILKNYLPISVFEIGDDLCFIGPGQLMGLIDISQTIFPATLSKVEVANHRMSIMKDNTWLA